MQQRKMLFDQHHEIAWSTRRVDVTWEINVRLRTATRLVATLRTKEEQLRPLND